MYFLLEKVNFHCHVSLLEGTFVCRSSLNQKNHQKKNSQGGPVEFTLPEILKLTFRPWKIDGWKMNFRLGFV